MPITLTEKAANEVKRVQQQQHLEEAFLRVGAASGGCSSYTYRLELDVAFDAGADEEYECHGVRVVVDKRSALLLEGTTIDWHEGPDASGFSFDNPNLARPHGHGDAFEV